ncbi:MAG: Fic family protein [Thermomicrobiales bacterium]|nr:Fic family protein [Thermomicrobiales bacterium]
MRRESFTPHAPGELIHDPRVHLAFVPAPLPATLALELETVSLLAEAQGALGELRGVGRGLPNPHLLINPFLRQEAVMSSRIEGTTSGLQQLLLFEADPAADDGRSDVHEVANYVAALELGFSLLESMPISLRLIRQVHARLMADVRGGDQRPGEFRQQPVIIGHRGATPENARFVPPPVLEMSAALNDLELYIGQRSSPLPFLIQLALVHYQFEAIHPFMDGNGRMGRLLIALQLREQELLPEPLLYLSGYFAQHEDAYRDLLLRVSTHGDWQSWLDFFLTGVYRQSVDTLARAHELLDLREQMHAWAPAASRSPNLGLLVDLLFTKPVISVGDVERSLQITPRPANDLVQRLIEAGYLEELTGQARNRRFGAMDILRILTPVAE